MDTLREIESGVTAWFESVMDKGGMPGLFKDCADAFEPFTVTATGAASAVLGWMDKLGALKGLSKESLLRRAEWARSLQDPESTLFIDPNLERHLLPEVENDPVQLKCFRRAVTKYAEPVVRAGGLEPLTPVRLTDPRPDPAPESLMRDILDLDWEKHPYAAGSQAGGLCIEFFTYVCGGKTQYIPCLEESLNFLLSRQNPLTGMWGSGDLSVGEQVSATLKVGGRFIWQLRCPFPRMDRLAESVLKAHRDGKIYESDSMCMKRNMLELAVTCLLNGDTLKDEMRVCVRESLDLILRHRQPDGAFASESTGTSDIGWCGARVADFSRTPRSNINGTQGAVYAADLAAFALGGASATWPGYKKDIIDAGEKHSLRVKINHSGKAEITGS
jgi:hypothetical protein